MHKILIDTCVWLDMAKDSHLRPALFALEELVASEQVNLVLPQTVCDEFASNKDRVIKEGGRNATNVVKQAKQLVDRFGQDVEKRAAIAQLNEIEPRVPSMEDAARDAVQRIEALFGRVPVLETTDNIKLRAVQRAIGKKAPFHQNKNTMNDTILLETYASLLESADVEEADTYIFVTHNDKDFSYVGVHNQKPHPDIANYFAASSSQYSLNLPAVLRSIDENIFEDAVLTEQGLPYEPRSLAEIQAEQNLLWNQVWYNRHWYTRSQLESGEIELVDKETFPVIDHATRPVQRDVWAQALAAAARVEAEFGLENLRPWNDFEWGMINGKLSALNWILGDEWDFLDT